MSLDALIRIVAGVAAVAIAGAPAAAWVVAKVKAFKPAAGEASQIGIGEMRTVLDLAERCKAAGCVDGVSLCQQLIDVMLGGCPGKAAKK